MVNVHLNFDKSNLKSKTSVERLKKKIKELVGDGNNPEVIDLKLSTSDYLKEELLEKKNFNFDSYKDDIFVKLIDKNIRKSDDDNNSKEKVENTGKLMIKQLLKKLNDERTGVKHKDLKEVKKNAGKELYKKYDILKNIYGAPIEKPHILIRDCEKFRDQIEIFSSGFMQFHEEDKINDMVRDYHRIISDRLGWKLLTMDEFIVKYYKESNDDHELINLNENIDSDTESDND